MTKLPVALAVICMIVGSLAVVLSASMNAPESPTAIGEARVDLGTRSARVVEQVEYRDGVTRVVDLILDNGQPVGELNDPDLAKAWEIVDSIWPPSMWADLNQISLIDEGPRGLVGVVHRSSLGGWILSVDRSDLGDRNLVEETIIHEIAHMATLDAEHFSFDTAAACSGVDMTVGCAAVGSFMARWAETFWPGGMVDSDAADLVDSYAATGPQEDLAETFTAWVASWPVRSASVAARIDMLAADPAMSLLATELRDGRR